MTGSKITVQEVTCSPRPCHSPDPTNTDDYCDREYIYKASLTPPRISRQLLNSLSTSSSGVEWSSEPVLVHSWPLDIRSRHRDPALSTRRTIKSAASDRLQANFRAGFHIDCVLKESRRRVARQSTCLLQVFWKEAGGQTWSQRTYDWSTGEGSVQFQIS